MSLISAAKSHANADIEELENLLNLSDPLIGSDDPRRVYIEESKNLLSKANVRIRNVSPRNIGQWASVAFDLDMINNYLSSVRYNLTYVAPKERLPLLAADARRQLFYLPEPEQATERETLDNALKSMEGLQDENLEKKTRNSLAHVIACVSKYKKVVYHKSSIVRSRLTTMFFVLSGLLFICYAAIPLAITIPDVPSCHVLAVVFAVQILGAVGGALSAMQSRPEGIRPIHELYIQETLMFLRPVVGASAAVGIALMQIAGVVEIFPQSEQSQNIGMDTRVVLFVAFLAGFSERFFTGQIETLVGGKEAQ